MTSLIFTSTGLKRQSTDEDESVKKAVAESVINHKRLTAAVRKVKYSPYIPTDEYAAELIAAYENEED